MAENSQLSDETKNNSTDTSSTDASSAVIGNHENAIVPHKISNHDKLVQTMVMVDGEWINVNDTNDQANMKEDMHKVNKKVVEAQKGIVEAKNSAESAVKYADSAVSASKVNSDALVAQSSAISEAKAAADDAASKAQFIKENASSEAAAIRNQVVDVANNVSSVKADVASATSDVANLKVDVQANSAAIIKTNEAVSIQSKNSSDAINELKIANGQVESIAKDAKNNATVAKQTADTATTLAQDAKSNAVLATQTATSATVEATNATSTATKAELSVSGLTTRVTAVEGDNKKLSNQFISTETILQQTKDQLLKKADKSVVDQANNLISQLSAEQKTMADQINQKVSSVEYQTLKDKVNGMNGGGKNLLKGTRDFNSKYWYCSDSNYSFLADNPVDSSVKVIHSYGDWASFRYNQTIQLDPNKNYMISTDIAIYGNDGNGLYITAFGNLDGVARSLTNDVNLAGFPKQKDGEGFKRIYLPLNIRGKKLDTFRIEGHGDWNAVLGSVFISKISLYEGNTQQGWEDSSDDLIENIQKNATAIDENSKLISLMAKQTDVDNVKNTAQQISSRLDILAGEVKSKVDETRVNNIVDGKGYATTSTVQSLVDQKAGTINESITNLSTELKNNSGGGINLLLNTGTLQFSANVTSQTNSPNSADGLWHLSVGSLADWLKDNPNITKLGISYDYELTGTTKTSGIIRFGVNQAPAWEYISGYNLDGKPLKGRAKIIVDVTDAMRNTHTDITRIRGDGLPIGATLKITHPKWEIGAVTPYSQAPSDDATVTQLQSVTASIDGLQSAVTNYQKDASSKYTQLSDLMQSKVNKGDLESVRTQLASSINERIQKGNLITQFNLEAGRTLIQSNKIYFDADSFVMSPNSKAFIPSAYITNINADKITTGTLDAAKFNVKNFSADNIVGGTLNGVVVKTGANDRYFQTSKDNIYWVRKGSMSLVGNDTYLNSANGLNIADEKNIQLTTWGGAIVNKDGSITNNSGNSGHPKIIIDDEGKYNPDDIYGSAFGGGPGDSEIAQWVGNKEYTALTRNQGFTVRLNDGNNKSIFAIQKDNKVGFYVGGGDDGSEIRIAGSGPIKLQGRYIDDGFNDGMTHTLGNLQVDNLHVRKWLGVDQSKNAIVKTGQGSVTINAYETAEYYFGDIGEGRTGADGIAYIGIEKLFNETVNTTIPYHVFITAYGPGNIWVDQREHNHFIVKSDQPNLKFSWEIKAKRKGYEHTRLQNVDDKLNHMTATS